MFCLQTVVFIFNYWCEIINTVNYKRVENVIVLKMNNLSHLPVNLRSIKSINSRIFKNIIVFEFT